MGVLAGLMAYWGFADTVNVAAAPFLAREFEIGDSGIAWTFGWISLGALMSLPIARAADRLGRRRVLLLCLLAAVPVGLASALAPSRAGFIGAQILLQGVKGASLTLIPVMVAEASAFDRRASGHGAIGIAASLGAGCAIVLVTACANLPGSWRWGWAAAALGLLALPLVRARLPESARFERAAAMGETRSSRGRELLSHAYRARTIGVLGVTSLSLMAVAGTQAWIMYHAVRNLGMAPMLATTVMIGGGAAGMIGFPLAARLSESWGRRRTFAFSGLSYVVASIAFYRVPPDFAPSPAVGLVVTFAGMTMMSAAASVPMRAVATELFPTALRGAISGWIAITGAAAAVFVNFAVGLLAEWLGGLAVAAQVVSCCMALAVATFLLLLPETAGLELEEAAAGRSSPH